MDIHKDPGEVQLPSTGWVGGGGGWGYVARWHWKTPLSFFLLCSDGGGLTAHLACKNNRSLPLLGHRDAVAASVTTGYWEEVAQPGTSPSQGPLIHQLSWRIQNVGCVFLLNIYF